MADRWDRGVRRLLTGGACLVAAVLLLAGACAAREPFRRTALSVLQMNLCDSGIAGCYTGRSVAQAVALIRARTPDVVTLNEVCRDDVSVLSRTLSDAVRGAVVVSDFEAAVDRRTGRAVRCLDGQQYGIGIVARVPPFQAHPVYRARYPMQDAGDPEERVWICLHAVGGFYACTTHLANRHAPVALAQCRYLFDTAIPAMRARGGPSPLVLGADLNLGSHSSPAVRSCLPSGYGDADDGGTQHIVSGGGYVVTSSTFLGMHGTTDHPGLFVTLAKAR
jgi:hypothetical protein